MWLKHDSLIDIWDQSLTDWYVVFEHGDMPYWWAKYLHAGFRHCWALRWDGFNWIAINPRLGHTDVEVLPYYNHDDIENIHIDTDCSVIIHAKVWRESKRIRTPYPVAMSCVEQIKALLGIRKWLLFTPYQLFKHLSGVKNGKFIQFTKSTKSTS